MNIELSTTSNNTHDIFTENLRTLASGQQISSDSSGNIILEIAAQFNNAASPVPYDYMLNILNDIQLEEVLNRGAEISDWIGDMGEETNLEIVRNVAERLAYDQNGDVIPVKLYEKRINSLMALINTRHPTMHMNPEIGGPDGLLPQYSFVVNQIKHLPNDADKNLLIEQKARLEQEIADGLQKPYRTPDVLVERQQDYGGLNNAHTAIEKAERVIIDVASGIYPKTYHTIQYGAVGLGDWGLRDGDGNTTIKVNMQLAEFFISQMKMLEERVKPMYEHLLDDSNFSAALSKEEKQKLQSVIDLIDQSLANSKPHLEWLENYDFDKDTDGSQLAEFIVELQSTMDKRITDIDALIAPITDIKNATKNEQLLKETILISSRLKKHGITFAQYYYRLNQSVIDEAANYDNGDKFDTKLDDAAYDAAYLQDIEMLLEGVENGSGDIFELIKDCKNTTLKKHLTLINIGAKYIDSHSDNVFLVADASRVNTMLYLLSELERYNLHDNSNTVPLLENQAGQDRATEITEGMIHNSHEFEHVTKIRERADKVFAEMVVQIGYSDIGRYIGPMSLYSSDLAKQRVVKAVKRALDKAGLESHRDNIVIAFHDTHGASPGRNEHPRSHIDTLRNIVSPFFLNVVKKANLDTEFRESLQGQGAQGKILGTEHSALAYIAQTMDYLTADHSYVEDDPLIELFEDENSPAFKLYQDARDIHEILANDENYHYLIGTFVNMMFTSGSRPVNRNAKKILPRAIQHNGTLQQLAVLATTTYGLAAAIRKNPETHEKLMRESKEYRRRMIGIEMMMDKAMPEVISAYIEQFNPQTWYDKAAATNDKGLQEKYNRLAQHWEEAGLYDMFKPVVEQITDDFADLKKIRSDLNLSDDPLNDPEYVAKVEAQKTNARITHGIRIAAIQDQQVKTMDIDPDMFESPKAYQDFIHRVLIMQKEPLAELENYVTPEKSGSVIVPMRQSREVIELASQIPTLQYGAVG